MGSATGKAATNKESSAESQLTSLIQQVQGETDPVRQELSKQYVEALQTGGVGAQIPLISAAQQQSRQATSQALQGVTNDLSRGRLAGTPFGARALAQTRLAGEQTTGLLPSQITQNFLQGAPQFAFGGLAPSVGGYSQLSGLGQQRDIAKAQNTASLISGTTSGLTSGLGGSLGSGAGAGIAAALFT